MNRGEGGLAKPVTEAQIQAYADGQLGESERLAVDAYLAANPAIRERVTAYALQNLELRAVFAAHAAADLPDRIKSLGRDLADAFAKRRQS